MGYRKEMLTAFLPMGMPMDFRWVSHLDFQMVIKKVCLLKVTLKANLTVLLMGFRSENQKDFLMVMLMEILMVIQTDFLMALPMENRMVIQTVIRTDFQMASLMVIQMVIQTVN